MDPALPEQIRLKLDALPTSPGVYLMKDAGGRVIYVGKARSLRPRVRSYFQEGAHDGRPQFSALVRKVVDLDCLITDTDSEALILEANQIKLHRPRYNIYLKDDKKYPFIRITDEPFPRVFATRDLVKDGSRYLGPYSNVKAMYTALKVMHRAFPVRSCHHRLPSERVNVCLDFHIHRCQGPCQGLVDSEAYRETVQRAVRFLRGNTAAVAGDLEERMASASTQQRYELAAVYRDQLKAVDTMRSRQKVVLEEPVDRDVIGMAHRDDEACCAVLEIREGRLVGQKHHFLNGVVDSTPEEVVSAFVRQFYLETDFVPDQIHLPVAPADADLIAAWLSRKAGATVTLACPQRGPKADMLEMADGNAAHLLEERQSKRELQKQRIPQAVSALQRDLRLAGPPRRIDAVDISNLQGSDTVGSLVCFVDGAPRRSEYRHFRIRDLEGPDDFASIHQVIRRRYQSLGERGQPLPDLLVIDGGKGQLGSALQALRELGVEAQPVVGLAKRLEEVFLPGQGDPVLLPKASAGLRLLQALRDEAHRFALSYHRNLRTKRTIRSELDDIPGVGATRRAALLQAFGSVERLRQASAEDIARVKGFSAKLAQAVKSHLAREGKVET